MIIYIYIYIERERERERQREENMIEIVDLSKGTREKWKREKRMIVNNIEIHCICV
jgi:hypothetical protein